MRTASARTQGATGAAATEAAGKRAAQLAAHAAAAGAKRGRGDAEVDASDPGQEIVPGVVKRRVLNAHRPVVEGTALAENVSQVRVCAACVRVARRPWAVRCMRPLQALGSLQAATATHTSRTCPSLSPQGQLDPAAPIPVAEPPARDAEPQQDQEAAAAAAAGGAAAAADSSAEPMDAEGAGAGGGTAKALPAHRHLMPMCASWFSMFAIHGHERRGLPEAFSGNMPGLTPTVRACTACFGLVYALGCPSAARLCHVWPLRETTPPS